MKSKRDELIAVVVELGALFPEWRFGQLVANLAASARGPDAESVWDAEDDELIAAAQRLIERNRSREQVPV